MFNEHCLYDSYKADAFLQGPKSQHGAMAYCRPTQKNELKTDIGFQRPVLARILESSFSRSAEQVFYTL